jgi:DNA processing protein
LPSHANVWIMLRERSSHHAVISRGRPLRAFTPAAETGKGTRLMDLLDALALSMLPASRSRVAAAFKDLRHVSSTADPLLATLAACRVPEEERVGQAAVARSRAVAALDSSRATPIVPVAWNAAEFPPLLGCIPDPPPVVWTLGNLAAATLRAVAIVGSRAATSYALDVAYRLGQELAERGLVVVSGLARGVDSAAHRGCLAAGGSTVAVLGSGLDHIYPREHEPLAQQIRDKGCLISELWPGAWPMPEHFPLRNRIISGISLAVVVVEASENSGSLITARYALEQGRDVMAVPGNVLTGRNRGSHSLLKDGAKVVESADDILDGLGWPVAGTPPAVVSKLLNSDTLLSRMETGEVYRLEELMELTGVTGTKLLARLMELELAGAVTQTGSGFSRRLVT